MEIFCDLYVLFNHTFSQFRDELLFILLFFSCCVCVRARVCVCAHVHFLKPYLHFRHDTEKPLKDQRVLEITYDSHFAIFPICESVVMFAV